MLKKNLNKIYCKSSWKFIEFVMENHGKAMEFSSHSVVGTLVKYRGLGAELRTFLWVGAKSHSF